jgi:drug/metabolite transporter (DMT)-like permease
VLIARRAYLTGLLLGVVGAVCFSGKAIIVKLAYAQDSDPVTLIALRMIVAAPLFAVTYWWTSRSAPAMTKADFWTVVGLGALGYYAASFLDFLGLQFISAGLERIILYLTPTFVLLLNVFGLRKPVSRYEFVALLLSYSGVVFVFWHDLNLIGPKVWLGSLLVLASALCYALYLAGSGQLVKRFGAIRLTSLASLVSSALCIGQALLINPQALLTQTQSVYGLSLINGVLCTVVPVFLTMFAIAAIGSTAASQTGLVGPISTIALAAWFLSEPVTGTQLIGTVIVLAGVFVLSLKKTAPLATMPTKM